MQVGPKDLSEAEHKPIVAHWYAEWRDDDLRRRAITRGEPGGQARLVAYTLLIVIPTVRGILASSQGQMAVLGDAVGILCDVLRLRARGHILDNVSGELALLIAL